MIDQRTPVLLQQGFNPVTIAAAGAVGRNNYTVRTDRGQLKQFDFIPFFSTNAALSENNFFTFSAGGQILVKNQSLGMWAYNAQYGKNRDWKIKSLTSEAQVLQMVLDNTAGANLQGLQTIAEYTTPQHEEFLKKFHARYKYGHGLKRREYQNIVTATGADQTAAISDRLERNNGDIIGVGVSTSNLEDDINDCFYSLSIDGITIIENITGLKASIANGRDDYMLPILIRAGATFEFSIFATSGLANDVKFSVNFYFDN